MGAGGRQNYAQAAMQSLFGEQLKQLENQAAQPAEVNQELVEQYTPQPSSVGDTVQNVLKRYTEGTGEAPTSQSVGLQGLLDKIAIEQKALDELQFSETKTRKSLFTVIMKDVVVLQDWQEVNLVWLEPQQKYQKVLLIDQLHSQGLYQLLLVILVQVVQVTHNKELKMSLKHLHVLQ